MYVHFHLIGSVTACIQNVVEVFDQSGGMVGMRDIMCMIFQV